MSDPKKHHYISVFHLKNFCNEEGKIWYFNKNNPENISENDPRRVFVKNHLNTVVLGGQKDFSIERELSKIESETAPVVEKMINAVRQNQKPNLSVAEKKIWDRYFYLQFKRVPEMWASLEYIKNFDENYDRVLQNFLDRGGQMPVSQLEELRSPEGKKRMLKNVQAQTFLKGQQAILPLLYGMGLAFAKIENPNKSFIIGSNPILKLTFNGNYRLGRPGAEIWLPVSYDIAVSPVPGKGQENIININDPNWIRDFNLAVFKKSNEIGSRSRQHISSLVNAR